MEKRANGEALEFAAGRYELHEVIGRGGTAVVHRATDRVTNKSVALKQLVIAAEKRHRDVVALFEREYRTLAELSHPSIIEVYEYGIEGADAFYTMEFVPGADLRERAPWPWREACALVSQTCSALSLVHSRGLIHRDISPRNVRCLEDGRAKLIDFGAMVPMGVSKVIVGTPAFLAPEVLFRAALDARTDLFSLGATLYFALTGRVAYPARSLTELAAAWRTKPELPSKLDPDIPEGLDGLVMSLLSLEPALRPRAAAEVMQRLITISGSPNVESPVVSRGYLSAPIVVGRARELDAIRADMARAFGGHGGSALIRAASGLGRSRLLETCVLEAKTSGATVLRIDEIDKSKGSTVTAQSVLSLCASHPVVLVADDVQTLDLEARRVLVALSGEAAHAKLFLLMTAEASSLRRDDPALGVLAGVAKSYELGSLDRTDIAALFRSVFGDVPNLRLVSDRIFDVSGGSPRVSMDLARCLVDGGTLAYEAGVWVLPASLEELELPASAEETLLRQLEALSPLARRFVEAHALASHEAFALEDYQLLAPEAQFAAVDRAVMELLERQVLKSEGRTYVLSHRGWAAVAAAHCVDAMRRERHRAIARLYASHPGVEPVHHLLDAGLTESALDHLLGKLRAASGGQSLHGQSKMTGAHLASIVERGLAVALELGRPARDIYDLRDWLAKFSAVMTEEEVYYRAAPPWLEQLRQDSGLAHWEADTTSSDAAARLMQALQAASARYAETPERDRVYRTDEAIRGLATYVVVSIAVGTRAQDVRLIDGLPDLLAPFVPLSRVVAVIRENAAGSREARVCARPERGRGLWESVYEQLCQIDESELPVVDAIRKAIATGIATLESAMGVIPGSKWLALVEKDPFHRVGTLYLKRAVQLQQGDWEAAENFRKQAEELAIEARGHQMFTTSIFIELAAYRMAGDLIGVKQIVDRIEPLSKRLPGWAPWKVLADGDLQFLRGDLLAACASYESCLASPESAVSGSLWVAARAGLVETLVALGRFESARAVGLDSIRSCRAREIQLASHPISRALALAEAKLGDYSAAVARLDRVIEEQRSYGVTGLQLGASYEARARIAIWASDGAAIDEFGRLTASEYRHGRNSPLGARYERLLNEAQRSASRALPELGEFASSRHESEDVTSMAGCDPSLVATLALQGAPTPQERAEALQATALIFDNAH